MFGWAVDKMTVWGAVQKTASDIEFKLDGNELPCGEADGTGVGVIVKTIFIPKHRNKIS
jgi:hypothetical protein